jgi:hypothetical protein
MSTDGIKREEAGQPDAAGRGEESSYGYGARVAAEWRDFTPQHGRVREQAFSIARGQHHIPAGAVVGVYGSGKSTLLFAVLANIARDRVLPVWEEASSFLDRLVAPGERVGAQEFVGRVHHWIEGLRTDSSVFVKYEKDLNARQLGTVASAIKEALSQPTEQTVLLLDEMEQAYAHFLQRIDTADDQPLRALIDSCGNSKVRLLMAYAPESFHALGDADRGRMLRLAVPSLDSTAIQGAFGLTKGQANFAWWVSRGRARGVIKAVNEVIIPNSRGEFDGALLGLAEALEGLPGVFGVPAVLRTYVPIERLRELLDLTPRTDRVEGRNNMIDMRDRLTMAHHFIETLGDLERSRTEDVEVVVDELLQVLSAVADAQDRCFLTFDDFSAAVKLAAARAVELGRLSEPPEGLEPGRAFYAIARTPETRLALPFSLQSLANDIFPSPFTDPVLPLANGRLPARGDVDRVFEDIVIDYPVFEWRDEGCLILRDLSALESWLRDELAQGGEDPPLRVLLLDERGTPTNLIVLAREAGRLAFRSVGQFHACFIKCLAIRARQSRLGNELGNVASAVRLQDRQLGRKIDWHLARIGRLLEEVDARPQRRWQSAVAAARGDNLSGVMGRLAEDSPGLLALLYLFKPCRPETRKVLAELSGALAETSDLRKLASAAAPGRQLEGAGVVVDELLPGRSGVAGRQRWVDTQFAGRTELRAVLDTFGSAESAGILGKLLNPHSGGRMERLISFHAGKLSDLSVRLRIV